MTMQEPHTALTNFVRGRLVSPALYSDNGELLLLLRRFVRTIMALVSHGCARADSKLLPSGKARHKLSRVLSLN